MTKLSIITINLNNRDGLAKTVESVLHQTFKAFELIIVDGNSTDGSKEVMHQFTGLNVKKISEKDNGIYEAMNKGIGLAKGDYLLFLNSGDYLNSANTLEEVFANKMDTDIVYGNMWIEEAKTGKRLGQMPQKLTPWHFYIDTLWHPVSFIKRELFARYGYYNEQYRIVADYDFFVKSIIKHQATYKHVAVIISTFNTDGISSKADNSMVISIERKKIQQTYFTASQLTLFHWRFIITRLWPNKLKSIAKKTLKLNMK